MQAIEGKNIKDTPIHCQTNRRPSKINWLGWTSWKEDVFATDILFSTKKYHWKVSMIFSYLSHAIFCNCVVFSSSFGDFSYVSSSTIFSLNDVFSYWQLFLSDILLGLRPVTLTLHFKSYPFLF
jgi:hypothetical protein